MFEQLLAKFRKDGKTPSAARKKAGSTRRQGKTGSGSNAPSGIKALWTRLSRRKAAEQSAAGETEPSGIESGKGKKGRSATKSRRGIKQKQKRPASGNGGEKGLFGGLFSRFGRKKKDAKVYREFSEDDYDELPESDSPESEIAEKSDFPEDVLVEVVMEPEGGVAAADDEADKQNNEWEEDDFQETTRSGRLGFLRRLLPARGQSAGRPAKSSGSLRQPGRGKLLILLAAILAVVVGYLAISWFWPDPPPAYVPPVHHPIIDDDIPLSDENDALDNELSDDLNHEAVPDSEPQPQLAPVIPIAPPSDIITDEDTALVEQFFNISSSDALSPTPANTDHLDDDIAAQADQTPTDPEPEPAIDDKFDIEVADTGIASLDPLSFDKTPASVPTVSSPAPEAEPVSIQESERGGVDEETDEPLLPQSALRDEPPIAEPSVSTDPSSEPRAVRPPVPRLASRGDPAEYGRLAGALVVFANSEPAVTVKTGRNLGLTIADLDAVDVSRLGEFGFVEELDFSECDAPLPAAILTELGGFGQLRSFKLNNIISPDPEAFFTALASISTLEELQIRHCEALDDTGAAALTGIRNLRSLYLGSLGGMTASGLAKFAAVPTLERLSIATPLGIDAQGVVGLSRSQSLRVVHLADCGWVGTKRDNDQNSQPATSEDVEELGDVIVDEPPVVGNEVDAAGEGDSLLASENLAALSAILKLEELGVPADYFTADQKVLEKFANLRTLILCYADRLPACNLAAALPELSALELHDFNVGSGKFGGFINCPELRRLKICSGSFGDKDWDSLLGLAALEELVICGTPRVNGTGLGKLSALRNLRRLDLSDCRYLDFRQLSGLSRLSELRVLNLDAGEHKWRKSEELDSAMRYLAAIPNLRALNLRSAKDLGVKGAQSLCGSRTLEFVWLDGGMTLEAFAAFTNMPALKHIVIDPTYSQSLLEEGMERLAELLGRNDVSISVMRDSEGLFWEMVDSYGH